MTRFVAACILYGKRIWDQTGSVGRMPHPSANILGKGPAWVLPKELEQPSLCRLLAGDCSRL